MTSQFLSPIWKINWLTDPLLSFIVFVQMESWRVTFNPSRDLGHKFEMQGLTFSEELCVGTLLLFHSSQLIVSGENRAKIAAAGDGGETPGLEQKLWQPLAFLPLLASGWPSVPWAEPCPCDVSAARSFELCVAARPLRDARSLPDLTVLEVPAVVPALQPFCTHASCFLSAGGCHLPRLPLLPAEALRAVGSSCSSSICRSAALSFSSLLSHKDWWGATERGCVRGSSARGAASSGPLC